MSIIDDIRQSYRQGDMLQRLIYINVAVFLIYFIFWNILGRFFWVGAAPLWFELLPQYFMVPASLGNLIRQPWSIFTYMFLHLGFLHLLFNMIWLYFGGQIFKEFMGSRKLLSTYLLGGLAGAVAYILAFNIFPIFSDQLENSHALGASASVLAIVIAAATYAPELRVRLFLIGEVKMKHIAIAAVALDIFSLSGTSNLGGHIAHLGGAIYGFWMARSLKEGRDINKGFEAWIDRFVNIFRPGPSARMKKVYRNKETQRPPRSDDAYRAEKVEKQKRIDAILDKIAESGYESLSQDEKDFLFKSGR
jgi:membrane associated rhomboid family serine protease